MTDIACPPVSLERAEGTTVLRLAGSLNLGVAAELHTAAVRALDAGGPVVVQCAAAEYLDVSALQILVALHGAVRAEGRPFALSAAPPWLGRHLGLVGLDELAGTIAPGAR